VADNDDPDLDEGGGKHDAEPAIVLIGGAAGGVQALQSLFVTLPERTGAAYVILVHLDAAYPSKLISIIRSCTKMPVIELGERQRLQADHVYVIPPERKLQMIDREVVAVEFEERRRQQTPIDQLFRSMAQHLGDGFAVVLSGAGADGALGVRTVKESGGTVLVQDPNEAKQASMPRSAIASGVADFVLPARHLGVRLVDLIRVKADVSGPEIRHFDEEQLGRALAHLRVRTGHDFSKYKRSTVLRRIARRMQVVGAASLAQYYDTLRDNAEEAQALLGDLLISVTTFFRDGAAFRMLAQDVLPELFAGKAADGKVRVWVPGCATGEEAYSFAMLLLEEASHHQAHRPMQVFGSDIDARALAAAREGRFPLSIEADVSAERLRRFFTREGNCYRARRELRDLVLFAGNDLLKDPPFSHLDLVSCRNVLIYLDRELQEQVCNTFHYALNPGGYLFLGASETGLNPPGLFRPIDRAARIYQSTATSEDGPRLLPRMRLAEHFAPLGRTMSPSAALDEATTHRRSLERLAPPSVLVDEAHCVVHLSESAGRFILPSGGVLSGNAVDLVRPELRFELRPALSRAFEQNQPTLSSPLVVHFDGIARHVQLMVKPVQESGSDARSALVMFIEGDAVDETLAASEHQVNEEPLRRLSQELEQTQVQLRAAREESDAANEELRAANEELQSINEEYRWTSQELETSKEELQSINAELLTVNSELKLNLEAISRAHGELQNLIVAADFATLFLDAGLRIKRFSERVTELFSITLADERRLITDFAHQLEYDGLMNDARTALTELAPIRRQVRSRGGRWYDMRIRPYRTMDDKIDGVVITFVDMPARDTP
jgi:two-component system, chemotaxis family, CheB/CheR fusion protein